MLRQLLLRLALLFAWPSWAWAATNQTDWGLVPLDQPTTISFGQTDLTTNFTDSYQFSLQGPASTTYAVTTSFDTCVSGCGNGRLSSSIYDANGPLLDSPGAILLGNGVYTLRVKGTGMGSGNALDYAGTISFSGMSTMAATSYLVSPVPEPEDWGLLLLSVLLLGTAVWRARDQTTGHQPSGDLSC